MVKNQPFYGEKPTILWGYHRDIMGYENDLRDVLVDFVNMGGTRTPPVYGKMNDSPAADQSHSAYPMPIPSFSMILPWEMHSLW